jgi:hypothetical protein
MKTLEERIEEVQKKMELQYLKGHNCEKTNDKLRKLLAEKFKQKTPSN